MLVLCKGDKPLQFLLPTVQQKMADFSPERDLTRFGFYLIGYASTGQVAVSILSNIYCIYFCCQ